MKTAKSENGILHSVLFKKPSKDDSLDSELDDIFKSSAGASTSKVSLSQESDLDSKRKRDQAKNISPPSSKRRKLSLSRVKPDSTPKVTTNAAKVSKVQSSPPSSEDEDDPALENAYLRKHLQKKQSLEVLAKLTEENDKAQGGTDSKEESEGSENPVDLKHESESKNPTSSSTRKRAIYKKSDESKEERDRRTIFIGNLSVDIVKSKVGKKAIINHIKERVEGCKVESVRFRSVAFKKASEPLAKEDGKGAIEEKLSLEPSARQQRDKERAARWQADQQAEETETKVYLKPNEKRRVAFIKQEFHDEASAVNAYMVFAYPDPDRSTNVPAILDPFEAAERAIDRCDNTVFMDRTIRVDRVMNKDKAPPGSSNTEIMKLTIFVGNLDFTAKEEDLRKFFEKLIEDEVETKGDESDHVRHVRIVRDGATQLGKGFAYVELKDRSVVDEILSMEPEKLKFAKRKLRLQRCKTLPGTKLPKSAPPAPITGRVQSQSAGVGLPRETTVHNIPKGDPSLGDKLRALSKTERKVAKSADPSRVARRLAKKKARNALQRQGVKGKVESKKGRSSLNKKESKGIKHRKAMS